ncbi:cathepsin O isoform X3 [Carcharodon carcharias]|uniref:cathepsin O isoform X3 n=1 Tax=Carcharodon carcharias TaxID=13397 RepID=UPI001B7E6B7C|nr:cathepsin O isoform X3 [Carcharodon carcharias]
MPWAFLLLCLSSTQLAFSGSLYFQLAGNESGEASAGHSEKLFQRFVAKYNRSYSAGGPQFIHKYQVFQESIQRHYTMNLVSSILPNESGSAIYGINQFSDMSSEVFRATYLSSRSVQLPKYTSLLKDAKRPALPSKFDWRDKNVVTPVRNQESCGGCWAFSVVESIESSCAIKWGQLELLSAQEVIDCSYMDAGCKGGSPISALMWLNQSKAKVMKESVYPFNAKTGMCHYFSRSIRGVTITGYKAYSFREKDKTIMDPGLNAAFLRALNTMEEEGGRDDDKCKFRKRPHQRSRVKEDQSKNMRVRRIDPDNGGNSPDLGYTYLQMS